VVGVNRVNNDENAVFILMLRDPETWFLEDVLGQYKIGTDEEFIEGLYAEQTEDGAQVCLHIGVGHIWADISDELFEYIFDKYDADLLPEFVSELFDIDSDYNPMWEARFTFNDNPAEMEDMIRQVLAGHRKALSVLYSNSSVEGGFCE